MCNDHSRLLRLALAIVLLGASIDSQAQNSGYLMDQRALPVRSGFGLCWRTGYWSPAMAIEECDPDLIKKVAMPAPPPVPVAPPPSPPPPTPRPVAQKLTLSADALFDFDRSSLRAEGKAALDALLADSRDLNLEVILVVGHTDRIGSEGYNQGLSERRAATVKEYLIGHGIDPARIRAEGVGERQPVTAAECRHLGRENRANRQLVQCLQPDRRVVVEVIGSR